MTKAQFIKKCQAVGRKMARTHTLSDGEFEFAGPIRDLRTKYRDGLGGELTIKVREATTRLALKSMAQGISKALR
jgi:hypothetical protein